MISTCIHHPGQNHLFHWWLQSDDVSNSMIPPTFISFDSSVNKSFSSIGKRFKFQLQKKVLKNVLHAKIETKKRDESSRDALHNNVNIVVKTTELYT